MRRHFLEFIDQKTMLASTCPRYKENILFKTMVVNLFHGWHVYISLMKSMIAWYDIIPCTACKTTTVVKMLLECKRSTIECRLGLEEILGDKKFDIMKYMI